MTACLQRPRVTHVIAGIDTFDGGPAYSVPRLCSALGVAADITLLSVARDPREIRDVARPGYRDRAFLWNYRGFPILQGLRASSGLAAGLQEQMKCDDIVHGHGLWLMPNLYSGWAARAEAKPLIVTPRGMLSKTALSFSYWKKKLFWAVLQGPALRDVSCFHATSEQEHDEIRAFGLTAPIAVIPNGIDIPSLPAANGSLRIRTILSLGRLHPKKGLDRLLRSWASLERDFPDWQLRIVGPDEDGYGALLQNLASGLGLKRAFIEPAVFGTARDELLANIDLFVLPSLNENFALTVAEALAQSVPVISTRGAPWAGLEMERCGWWIPHGVEPLTAALRDALILSPAERRAMGEKGRAWMMREFSWSGVAQKMLDVYGWLALRAPPPETVRFYKAR